MPGSRFGRVLWREGMPEAPAIGGDVYDVAGWLRAVRDWHLAADRRSEAAAVGEVLDGLGRANPEVVERGA